MIQKITLSLTNFFLLFSILFCTKATLHAQSITPSILTFDRICAGGVTNPTYKASFTYSGYAAGTTFVVELSDKTGSFATTTPTVFVSETDDAPDKKTITFSIPPNIVGSDTYSLRIKSSGGQPSSGSFFSSTTKQRFPIYYKIHDKQFTINNFNGNATICAGGSFVLSIDPDSTSPENDSPLKYASLSYNWYKDNGPTALPTLIAGASGPNFTVTAPGTYYVETNYGTCTSLSYSNRVIVSSSASGSSVTIDSSLGNPFCASGTGTVLTATAGNKYQWKKVGSADVLSTSRTHTTNESGVYTVDVDFGGCISTGTIDLKSNSFNASLNVPEENSIEAGTNLEVVVTTDASAPNYEWYLNNSVIDGVNTNTLKADKRGTYKVKISQSGGCVSTKELVFKVAFSTDPATDITKIANVISLSSYPYDVWDIPSEYKNENTNVKIISSNGDLVLDVVNYQGDWPPSGSIDIKNVNPVYYYVIQSDTGEKKGSITVLK